MSNDKIIKSALLLGLSGTVLWAIKNNKKIVPEIGGLNVVLNPQKLLDTTIDHLNLPDASKKVLGQGLKNFMANYIGENNDK